MPLKIFLFRKVILPHKNDLICSSELIEKDDTEEDVLTTKIQKSANKLCENYQNSEDTKLDFLEREICSPKINQHIENVEKKCVIGLSDSKSHGTCQESPTTTNPDFIR